jgi:hypothetical protein
VARCGSGHCLRNCVLSVYRGRRLYALWSQGEGQRVLWRQGSIVRCPLWGIEVCERSFVTTMVDCGSRFAVFACVEGICAIRRPCYTAWEAGDTSLIYRSSKTSTTTSGTFASKLCAFSTLASISSSVPAFQRRLLLSLTVMSWRVGNMSELN